MGLTALQVRILKRSFRTAVAAALATIYYQVFNLPQGYWAVISAVIVTEFNVHDSFKLSWSRFLGTAIGVIAGLMGILSMGATPWSVGISVFSTTMLCYALNLRESYRLAGATSVIVILASKSNPAEFALQRFIDVSIGILIALVVSLLVFPKKR